MERGERLAEGPNGGLTGPHPARRAYSVRIASMDLLVASISRCGKNG